MKKRETKFRELVEVSSDWIWEVNKEGVYTYSSPQVETLLGYKPDEVVGKTPFDLMPPEEAVRIKKFFNETTKNGEPIVALENVVLHKDGRRIVLETSGVPVFDKTVKVIGFRGVDRDITERKQTEDLLIKSEKKYRDLFEKSEDAILIIHNGKFVDCNQSTVNMLRYNKKDEFLNTHPSELSPEKQPDGKMSFTKANEMMKIAFKNGSHRFEWDHKRADGEIFPVEVLLTAISADEKDQILHTVWRDITDRKQAEEDMKIKINELEIFNDAAVDRELKINELRKEINELLGKLGEEQKYEIVE